MIIKSYLQSIFTTHVIGYSFRQKMYGEFLETSIIEKQFNTLLTLPAQPQNLHLTDIFVFFCITYMSSLYLNDLKYKKSFENIGKKNTDAVKINRHIELLFFIFAIIFTKDVENAI